MHVPRSVSTLPVSTVSNGAARDAQCLLDGDLSHANWTDVGDQGPINSMKYKFLSMPPLRYSKQRPD